MPCHYLKPCLEWSNFLRSRTIACLAIFLATFVTAPALWAGGTPDPGIGPLLEDNAMGGGLNGLPDNENQLLGVLGPDRGFGFGDYVSDDIDGLQSTLGDQARYRYLIEVPPLQNLLIIEIFDADTGAGDVAGTEEHDQNNTTGWDTSMIYDLIDPTGSVFASITLPPQDCDPVTVGLQTACNDAWSDLATFSVINPTAGHWTFRVFVPNQPPASDFDDNNSYGVRAHDGDASAAGVEYNVYLDTYAGVGQVYASDAAADPGFARSHDFYPYVTNGCGVDVNDWDGDDNGDESIELAVSTPVAGANGATSFDDLSGNAEWQQNQFADFTTDDDTSSYGLWNLRFLSGEFNFITCYLGDASAADPVLPPTSPGNGAEPDQQPEPGAIRLYLPADGSRYFGERDGADDAVIAPTKPAVSHAWQVQSGPDPIIAGATSRIEVTVTIANPTSWPIQFDATTTDPRVVTGHVPTNGGQTEYVAGSAMINNSSAAAGSGIDVTGAGPWDLTFAPGVIDAGDTVTLTYEIDVAPTAAGQVLLTGSGPSNGSRAIYLDETCADPLGGAARCSAAALPVATFDTGPLCPLAETVTVVGTPDVTVVKDASAVTDAGNGLFDATYTVTVTNSGTTDLSMVQVVDDLDAAFGGTATFSVTSGPSASGGLSANGSYDGDTDTNLLIAATSALMPGDSETIVYSVRFDPNSEPGPFVNTASFTATDPLANMVSGNDMATAPVPEDEALAVDKTILSGPTENGDGTFSVTYQVASQNTGNVDLANVQVTDDLASVFPGLDAVTTPIATGTLTANGGYDGDSDTDLLVAASSTLPVGATETVTYSVTFAPQGDTGPYTNTADGSATSPLGTAVDDSDTAQFTFVESPAISIEKSLNGALVDNADGTFTATFEIGIENSGDVTLSNVQVTDDLDATFTPPASVISVSPPIAMVTSGVGTLTANAAYDGSSDTALLVAASSMLDAAATGTVTFTVTFDSGSADATYTNSATASGDSPLSAPVSDSDSVDIDVEVGEAQIGLAKAVIGLVANPDGSFTVDLLFSLENLGGLNLTDVQVTDDLIATFPPPASLVSVTPPQASITSGTGTLTANMAYDGETDTDLLLAAMSSLDLGAEGEITMSATFDPAGGSDFENTAVAAADSAVGDTTDVSDDGTEPDADGDADPDETDENDPTPITPDVVVPAVEIPTADSWALILLALLLVGMALPVVRRT